MIKHYENIDELLKEVQLNRFTQYKECFQYVVKCLNYDECKKILLTWLDIETLKKAYKVDKYLNNIYKHGQSGGGKWEWDFIGDAMLHNNKSTVKFHLMSDCNRTCIAKACAEMLISEDKEQ